MKIIHQREKCIGCGLCASLCREVFKMAEDGLAVMPSPKVERIKEKQEDVLVLGRQVSCAEEAAAACPVSCIIIKK